MAGRVGNGQYRDTGPSSDDSVVASASINNHCDPQRRTPICTNSQLCSQVLTRFEKHHDSYAILTGGLCRAPNSASQCKSVAVFSSGAFASARSLEPTWRPRSQLEQESTESQSHTCSRSTSSCVHKGNHFSAFRRTHPALSQPSGQPSN
jgi:hypothetical protein